MRDLLRTVRRGVALAVAAALLFAAPAAGAAGNLNEFISSLSPAQSAVIQLGTSPTFQLVSTCKGMGLQAYISRSTAVDGDGAFLGGDVQDQFPMAESSSESGIYEGVPKGTWLQQSGQYYWQVRTVAQCTTTGGTVPWASQPVYVQVVGQPSSGGTVDVTQQDNGELLTIAEARAAIAQGVLKGTRKLARGLKRTCTRRGSGSILAVICTASWTDNKKYRYNGSFRMALNDDGTIEATFNGRRALLACVKKTKIKSKCFKKHRFTATIQ